MKRLHFWFIVLMSLLLIAAAGWGVVWYYAKQDTVPEEVEAGRIPLGGMKIGEAVELLNRYEDSLEKRTVTVRANVAAGGSKEWIAGDIGYKAEFAEAREALLKLREGDIWERAKYRYSFPKAFALAQSWDRDVFETAVRKEWGWIDGNEPKDASRTINEKDEVIYTPHSDAYRIDVEELSAEAEPWLIGDGGAAGGGGEKSLRLELPVKTVHPKVTLESLKAEGIDRKMIEFTTDFATSAEGRAYNVTSTAKTLNDWHLAPDEIFDYGKLVKETEAKYGYREAPVILNGKLVPGIGGGICQVSSTLYNAVLRTGLEVVERRNHSLPVAYLPKGQDATFASGAINFRFKNSTGKHLIIRTSVENRKLTVKLFGTMPKNIRYDIESVTVRTIDPSVQEVATASLAAGKKRTVQQGKPGYVVETYRTLLRDGKAESRERVSRDTYRAQPTIVNVGSGSGSPAPSETPDDGQPLLEDGIG